MRAHAATETHCTTKSEPVAESDVSRSPPVADVPISICALAAVFFEVVQRVGGYEGYGEVNAPVRMAAHRRLRLR